MRSVLAQFIQNELDAYATTQRLCGDSIIPFIVKAFEAYDEYRRLVSIPIDPKLTVSPSPFVHQELNGQNL